MSVHAFRIPDHTEDPRQHPELYTPEDAYWIARDLQVAAEYRANPNGPAREWATLAPSIRWHYLRRAEATIEQLETERRARAAENELRWRVAA